MALRQLRVLVVDDHQLMLEAVRAALGVVDGIEVVAATDSSADVLTLVEATRPDLVLLDIRMPGLDGLAVIRLLRERHPEVKIVVLSAVEDPQVVRAALEAGAASFLGKRIDPLDLAATLLQAAEGSAPRTLGLREGVEEARSEDPVLTDRELSVLGAVGRGLSNKQIARELWLAEQTVKFHLTKIYRKLAVANRTEAARYAYEHTLPQLSRGSDSRPGQAGRVAQRG